MYFPFPNLYLSLREIMKPKSFFLPKLRQKLLCKFLSNQMFYLSPQIKKSYASCKLKDILSHLSLETMNLKLSFSTEQQTIDSREREGVFLVVWFEKREGFLRDYNFF
ncbi:hypothetical protein AMTRI_Chr03g143150 [Amborella trichopoda]